MARQANNDYDVAIIGGGLSGLAAGIRLAHFGRRVAIFERHHRLGGLNSYFSRAGRHFDTGLHAMTNFAAAGDRRAPLNKLLRQLRIPYPALELCPQSRSSIYFPNHALGFTNDFQRLASEIATHFPASANGFQALVEKVRGHDAYSFSPAPLSARRVLTEHLDDPPLVEMLLCPTLYYGSAWERDVDFGQFCLLFRSLFLEGLCRPAAGIVTLLRILEQRFAESGGVLRLNCPVNQIDCRDGRVHSIQAGDQVVRAAAVLSSAGLPETLDLCVGLDLPAARRPRPGRLSFVESILVLAVPPASLGFRDCIAFYCATPEFHYEAAEALVDPRSAVLCAPGNFVGLEAAAGRCHLRITSLAGAEAWRRLAGDDYAEAKRAVAQRQIGLLDSRWPGIGEQVVFCDTFTPTTVERFTGRYNGAVYGSPDKAADGRTPVEGLFVCGTDQGFLGIVGALLSGISMANYHFLQDSSG